MHDPSISPYLNISEHIFSGLGFALSGVLLPASDVSQHIEPVHDRFHVGIFREPVDSVQSFLFNRLHNNALVVVVDWRHLLEISDHHKSSRSA